MTKEHTQLGFIPRLPRSLRQHSYLHWPPRHLRDRRSRWLGVGISRTGTGSDYIGQEPIAVAQAAVETSPRLEMDGTGIPRILFRGVGIVAWPLDGELFLPQWPCSPGTILGPAVHSPDAPGL